jgi:hypothetical protein
VPKPATHISRWVDGVVQLVADLLVDSDCLTDGNGGLSLEASKALTALLRDRGEMLFWEGHGHALAELARAVLEGEE